MSVELAVGLMVMTFLLGVVVASLVIHRNMED